MKIHIGNWPKNPAKERKVNIHIDPWDTWSMDNTLGLIIEPMLKQLKATQDGYPGDMEETEWSEILDKMIFAFESLNSDWEDQYHSGEIDFVSIPVDKDGNEVDRKNAEYYRLEKGPNDTHVFDEEGWKQHNARIQEGLELFGKYFRNLWT